MIRKNQKLRILEYIQSHGSITALEATEHFGCQRLAARIADLKEEGHIIGKRMELGTNRFGEPMHYARYTLIRKADTNKDIAQKGA